jgi:hypothetical protein
MPGIDEDILRELMHRCTEDLHAPSAVSDGIVIRHRRRRLRNRALSVAVTGAAAGTVFAVVASASGGAPRPAASGATTTPALTTGAPTTSPAFRLTAAQTALYRLSSAAAAAAPRPAGRYVELRERQDDYDRTSVIDSLTGDVWTYQQGAGVPSELPVDRHGSPTEAAFDKMPTDPSALRALLLTQAKQQQAQAVAEEKQMMAEHGKKAIPTLQPNLSEDDWVFEQATDMLWNPLVGPALRAALYKVLATTPGVVVSTHARDLAGRPAIEISRLDRAVGVDDQTFENPATGAVLETAFTYPRSMSEGPGTDLYLSVTGSNALPPNPYDN